MYGGSLYQNASLEEFVKKLSLNREIMANVAQPDINPDSATPEGEGAI